ncbi:MAG TPA: hypothetical protein VE221_00800 [Sphingomicrobium sp.]|nr:hypothetical protein [Sphingomicrobium sp.]
MTRILAGAAGFAALAAAAPSAAQYNYQRPYSYNQYNYGYTPYAMNTSVASQQCTAAVQNRLYTRRGLSGVISSLVGAYGTTPQVLSITSARSTGYGMVRVRGLASSGRYASNRYGAYGVGAYGALGYGYAKQADLSFRCDVDNRGNVRDVNISRR